MSAESQRVPLMASPGEPALPGLGGGPPLRQTWSCRGPVPEAQGGPGIRALLGAATPPPHSYALAAALISITCFLPRAPGGLVLFLQEGELWWGWDKRVSPGAMLPRQEGPSFAHMFLECCCPIYLRPPCSGRRHGPVWTL